MAKKKKKDPEQGQLKFKVPRTKVSISIDSNTWGEIIKRAESAGISNSRMVELLLKKVMKENEQLPLI